MWSIFSTYPETVSQCVGRKLKELRLEASRIALHDDVEKEVKERIAEEERAQNDVLVIDNEEEQRIDGDIEYRSEVEIEIVGVESEDIEQIVKGHKVKSIVTKPDIRDCLKSNATSKKEVNNPTKNTPTETRTKEAQPDLRKQGKRKFVKAQNIYEIPEVSAEESEPALIQNLKVRSKVTKPDIREWLDAKVQSKKGESSFEVETEKAYADMLLRMNTGEPDEILSRHFLEMRRRDYRSLAGRNYLNDKVIDEYFSLIQQRNQCDDLPKVYPLTTHAFSWLDGDYESHFSKVMSWCNEDLTGMEMLLIPIHKADHWSLVVVDVRRETLSYYDSIGGNRRRSNAPKVMRKFVEQYWRHKGKNIKLKVIVVDTAPLQRNGYDCGVFVCQNAEKISRDATGTTRQEDMPKAREIMAREIFFGALTKDSRPESLTVYPVDPSKKRNLKKQGCMKNVPVPSKENYRKSKQSVERVKVDPTLKDNSKKRRINWPKAVSKEWSKLDEDLSALLKILFSPPEKLAGAHPKIYMR